MSQLRHCPTLLLTQTLRHCSDNANPNANKSKYSHRWLLTDNREQRLKE